MNHLFLFKVVLTTVVCIFASSSGFAQGGGATTSLSGIVTDSSGAVIPGATVSIKSNATATEYHATTTENGTFTVPALHAGSYKVTISLMGFKTAVLNDVRVNAAVPASVRVSLEIGTLEETITVASGSEIVQTQTAAVATTFDVNQISKLPVGSRSVLEFVVNLPGVTTPGGSRNSIVNGLPQSTINITLDGMSVQDNHLKTGDGFFARVSPRQDAIEEVTVSSAAQGTQATGQGAVQIQFVTRSGSNRFAGSSYYYLRHHRLNSNTWFNNRDLDPDPATGKAPKAQDVLHQPGTRVGGPIVIPGLLDLRNRAFFFMNYEEERAPAQLTRNRTILHPQAQAGIFRYTTSSGVREVNLLALAAANGQLATLDPTVQRLLSDIRAATGTTGSISDLTDPSLQRYTFQVNREGLTRYPTARVDVNLSDRHRLSGSWSFTNLLSTPDTLNGRDPQFPGFPVTGAQHSKRYIYQNNLRSNFGGNLVNEFKVGFTGGATFFSPELNASLWGGTSIADQAGFHLNINAAGNITNAASGPTGQAREASTNLIENTLNWLKGAHSLTIGGSWTEVDLWLENQNLVPTINFGVVSGDPADALFTAANFPGSSATQRTDAADLYAVLTGRVSSITGVARLDPQSDEYVYSGKSLQRARMREVGLFVSDTWKWRPNLTLNLGLRYELQLPFYPLNNSYSTATMADVCGVSGVAANGSCNLFQQGVQTGKTPEFIQFNKGTHAYNIDWNNFAPNLGFAWTPYAKSGLFRTVLGAEGDSVLRAGYSLAYSRNGTSDFAGAMDDNPGIAITADRTHALGNLGPRGGVLLRNTADLGPPAFPQTRVYPMTDVVTGDIHIFDRTLQVPYAQSWTAGWQRKITNDMAIEARYVGTRHLQGWIDYNFNEVNIVENGFLDEFRLAQQNLQANIAAGRGANFRFFGPGTGTAPLPIFLAYFAGSPDAANPAAYGSSLFANSTFVNPLAIFNPDPFTAANALDADATRRANALKAGLPGNFLVANPHLLGGAVVTGNGGYTRFNGLQIELRKRLSGGLQFNSSYAFGQGYESSRYSFRRPRATTRDVGTEGDVTHAFKANWVYELPFGQGRRFGGNAGSWLDRLIGGWAFEGIARVQSGRLLDFGNVRLVGMTRDDLQKAFELRFDDANRVIYMLPQDIIDNTLAAFDVSATSPSGYGSRGAPQGRYLAPANGPDCIEIGQNLTTQGRTNMSEGFGDCGGRSLVVTGPALYRFDLSVGKRITLAGRVTALFRAEFLNAFNTPWFSPVTGFNSSASVANYNTPDSYRVTTADSGRIIQLVSRVSW